jgi:hypothetical protein
MFKLILRKCLATNAILIKHLKGNKLLCSICPRATMYEHKYKKGISDSCTAKTLLRVINYETCAAARLPGDIQRASSTD